VFWCGLVYIQIGLRAVLVTENMRKNSFKIILISMVLLYCMILTGCEKQICSYCGQEKECDEYDILGTKRYICRDCLGDTAMSLSGNVIVDYESDLIDPALYLPASSVSDDTAFVAGDLGSVSDNNEAVSAEDVLAMDIPPAKEEKEDTSGAGDNNHLSKDELVSAVAASLSSYNYFIQPDGDNNDKYSIYLGGDDAKIVVVFSSNQGAGSVIVSMLEGASLDDFTNVCISMNLAVLEGDNRDQDSNNIFNNAKSYGNYSSDGCKFYYMDGLNSADNDGVVATYEIKYE